MNTVGVMGCGWGPCRAGQLAYMLYRSAKVQQLIVPRGGTGLLIIPQVQTCAPSWRLVRCWRLPPDGQCDSAPPPPLHPSQIPRHCSTSCCTNRRFQGTPAPQHVQSFLAALAAHRSGSPLACSGLLWRPWQLTVPPIRRVSPRYYWQAGSRHALPTAPRRATWLLTGRGEVQARRPPAELAPRRALHLHVHPGVRASTTGR